MKANVWQYGKWRFGQMPSGAAPVSLLLTLPLKKRCKLSNKFIHLLP